jgi:cytochrome c-type biogenesis protein CcmH
MGWLFVLLLALIAGVAIIRFGGAARPSWELIGAALVLGIAGYVWQGSPRQPGAPRDAKAQVVAFDEDLARQRNGLSDRFGKAAGWLAMSDGMARSGDTQNAANVLVSGLKAEPENTDMWVGMGNALVAHAGGIITPSAEYSYKQAMKLKPQGNAAPYFYGLALAQSGDFEGAGKMWAPLYQRLPVNSELHAILTRQLLVLMRLSKMRDDAAGKAQSAP